MTDLQNITSTDEGANWIEPFATPMRRSSFGPTPAGQAWLDAHPEEAQKAEGYEPVTFIPFRTGKAERNEEGIWDRPAERRTDED